MLQCVAVCVAVRCSALQCVAVCCSVLRCVAVCCSVCCSVLWCVAVCCRKYEVFRSLSTLSTWWHVSNRSSLLCCSVCCSVLRCVAVCCRKDEVFRSLSTLFRSWLVSNHSSLYVLQCVLQCVDVSVSVFNRSSLYGVASISRLLWIIGLFCKRAL